MKILDSDYVTQIDGSFHCNILYMNSF